MPFLDESKSTPYLLRYELVKRRSIIERSRVVAKMRLNNASTRLLGGVDESKLRG
jgi:hypothetical protein